MGFKEEMLCSKSHEYVIKQDDKYVIGLTDYAIEQLGDIVFLELPEVGDEFAKGDTFANIESVKAASEIYMPISGEVVEINEEIVDSFSSVILDFNLTVLALFIYLSASSKNDSSALRILISLVPLTISEINPLVLSTKL